MRAVCRFLFACGAVAAGALVAFQLEGRRHRASRELMPHRIALAEMAATTSTPAPPSPVVPAPPRRRVPGDRILAVPLGVVATAAALAATLLAFRLVG